MHLLLSGEGAGDIGACDMSLAECEGGQFKAGPMSLIIDQCVGLSQDYDFSHLDNNCVSFVSKSYLVANKAPITKKKMSFRGKKRPVETKYYFENSKALAGIAKSKAEELGDTVIAVLFRDLDGTASAGRGDWQDKISSMIKGFEAEDYKFGVPMIPKPKSEAWLLCAVKDNPYQSCANLENESGNDQGRNPLKAQLAEALDDDDSATDINEMLKDKRIDVEQIDMPSFNQFKMILDEKVRLALGMSI